jgi:hypothetical protein
MYAFVCVCVCVCVFVCVSTSASGLSEASAGVSKDLCTMVEGWIYELREALLGQQQARLPVLLCSPSY